MKKFSFLFAILTSVAASAAVTVTPLSTDYAARKVTFSVSWTNAPAAPYNNRVWIWIDFCSVIGVTPQCFSTATITSPTITGGNGTITNITARGFFIAYNATNAGTTVTAILSNAPAGNFNWCVYGSDMPPNATVNAGGGYTLHGTKPFTINGSLRHDSNTFGAGTCITSITDPTGRPDGFAGTLTISNPNSPARCNAGAVMLSATASGGTTTAMTYTWTISGANYTTTTNAYTTASLSASVAYTVKVKNANNCESSPVNGNITINYPGNNGQTAHATCGCATGTTNCSGTCKTNGNYTTNNGACTGACNTAYVQQLNQCDEVLNTKYSTYTNTSCTDGCGPTESAACATEPGYYPDKGQWNSYGKCFSGCISACANYKYFYAYYVGPTSGYTCICKCCN
jgi:hypothetical protein